MNISKFILSLTVALLAGISTSGENVPEPKPKRHQQNIIKPRVFINPGHGGHDSNDRPEPFYNEGTGTKIPYYESDSNLAEGEALLTILREKGYEVYTSRYNNTSADDLALFEISQLALNSGADVFFAIHSNDTGTSRRANFPLALFRGYDNRPVMEGSRELGEIVTRNLYHMNATEWTRSGLTKGDWSFYNWGYGVGLGVLRWNKIPGILVETSFHDYIPERERFKNKSYSWLAAWTHSLSLDEFFNRSGYSKGVVAGTVRFDKPRGRNVIAFGNDKLQPANDIYVLLNDARDRELQSYHTDNYNNGFYIFSGLRAGKYAIEIEGVSSQEVLVKPNRTTFYNIVISTQGDNAKWTESVPTPSGSRHVNVGF